MRERPAQPDRDGTDDLTETSGSTVVRIVPDTSTGLGAVFLSAGAPSVIYTAGMALIDVEPHDTDLAEAIAVIAATMYGEPSAVPHAGDWNRHLRDLQTAQEQQLKVKIVYSRAWSEGVGERVIEPLRLVQTRRGWEVDAGPVGPEGNLRTFLLSNIRSLEVLAEGFLPPSHTAALLSKQRQTTTVRMMITQDARWAARLFAERMAVVEEDETSVKLDLHLLPPVGGRVAMIMLTSGTMTKVEPGALLPEALDTVENLLNHHQGGLA